MCRKLISNPKTSRTNVLSQALQNLLDLLDLLVDLAIVPVIRTHGHTPYEQPQATCGDARQQEQDVVGGLLLAGQIEVGATNGRFRTPVESGLIWCQQMCFIFPDTAAIVTPY